MSYTKAIDFNGVKCVEFSSGNYKAVLAYEIGSNVIRLTNEHEGVEFFRFKYSNSAEKLRASAEVWGLPSLYLPNRFADGVLRTSDAVYQLPVNETGHFNNHIHGFLHKRMHKLVEHKADNDTAIVKTSYLYDENDEFYQYFPVKFLAEYTFTLSAQGLDYNVKFTNLSDKMMPMSFATHTTICTPFLDSSNEKDIRITVPAGRKCILNDRCLPTGEMAELNDWDLEYRNGKKCPVLQNISNDMYEAWEMDVDGKPFYGILVTEIKSGKRICYEVSKEHKFWIIWNDKGFNGYFCPEPMTAMINAPNLHLPREITGYTEISPDNSYELWQKFYVG